MTDLYTFLKGHAAEFHPVLQFNPTKERLVAIDLSGHNPDLQHVDVKNTAELNSYISEQLKKAKAKLGIGGYNEDRQIYLRSDLLILRLLANLLFRKIEVFTLALMFGEMLVQKFLHHLAVVFIALPSMIILGTMAAPL